MSCRTNVVTLGQIIDHPVRLIPEAEMNLAARMRAGEITSKDVEELYTRSSGFADWFDKRGQQIWKRAVTAKP